MPGRPTIWITVGQGPIALAVGAGGGCLDVFTLIYPFFPLSPALWETAQYRLKYCLKWPFKPQTNKPTGSGCSKLTMSLVNVSLKFQMLITEICHYFLLQCKSFSHFLTKNTCIYSYKVIKHLTSLPLNELVKLTML